MGFLNQKKERIIFLDIDGVLGSLRYFKCKERDFILKYCRGTQIAEWIERNNYKGSYIVIDDDIDDIIFYKDLAKRLIKTSYYGWYDGFRFLHFLKGVWLLK